MKKKFGYCSVFMLLLTGLIPVLSACTPMLTTTPFLSEITISPATELVSDVGSSRQFTATGYYSDNSTKDITSQVNWGSTDSNVVTITSSGLASIVAAGESFVNASMPVARNANVIKSPDILLTAPSQSPATIVNVTIGNFKITLDRTSIPSGTVRFVIRNNGPAEHEFVVFKTDLPEDKLPVQGSQVIEDSPELNKIDEHEEIHVAHTVFLNVNLDPGNYVAICNIPHHYANGMHIQFTVK